MTKLQLNIISKIIFIIMLIPLYTCAALQNGKQSEKNNPIHVFCRLPPGTKISVISSQTWDLYRKKEEEHFFHVVISSHAETIIEFEDVQVAITKSKLVKPEKKTFHITRTSLKNANNIIKIFSYPKLKNLPQPHICLQ
ncbi:MAG: hypothetical protein OXC48_04770, partial [Endozoicomonadaceae bacterium]|nr:hypothetical protein [Endozoicomonadaceae bacterium]